MASVYLPHPFVRRAGIPILMYHSISDGDFESRHPYYRTTTPPSVFEQHLKYLHAKGYSAISLEEVVCLLRRGALPERCVALTFDDGFADFIDHAFPIMARYAFTGTVFLPTSHIGDISMRFKNMRYMTWSDVRELQQRGISFGSHTVSHQQLHGLDRERIREEILWSRQAIEDKTGSAVDSFAYPYAFPQTDEPFKAMLREILQESGYRYGVCTQIGRVGKRSDPLFLERLPVNSADDMDLLEAKMAGAYDWVGGIQSLSKRIRKPRTRA